MLVLQPATFDPNPDVLTLFCLHHDNAATPLLSHGVLFGLYSFCNILASIFPARSEPTKKQKAHANPARLFICMSAILPLPYRNVMIA